MSTTTARLTNNDSASTSAVTRAVETIPATLLLTALTAITAIGFCRVYSGWEFLGPMLAVVIGTHAVSFGFRLLNVPGYIAVPATVVGLFCLVAWKYYCLLYTSPSPRDRSVSRMPSSA